MDGHCHQATVCLVCRLFIMSACFPGQPGSPYDSGDLLSAGTAALFASWANSWLIASGLAVAPEESLDSGLPTPQGPLIPRCPASSVFQACGSRLRGAGGGGWMGGGGRAGMDFGARNSG